jgi:hypothetical protein
MGSDIKEGSKVKCNGLPVYSSPVRLDPEDSSKRSCMLFVVVSLQLGSISNLIDCPRIRLPLSPKAVLPSCLCVLVHIGGIT